MDEFKFSAIVWCLLWMLGATHCGRLYSRNVNSGNLRAKSLNTSVSRDMEAAEIPHKSILLQSSKAQSRQPSNDDLRANMSFDRRSLSTYALSFNPIDSCWRGNSAWASDRKQLASCAIGFGTQAVGGGIGQYYVVTDPGDDAVNPAPGTLRFGILQLTPLWITFATDMTIILKNELIFTSHKTIDGRGANVHIAYGPCLTIENVENVIIHGLHIHDCKPGTPGTVRSTSAEARYRGGSDGVGITVIASKSIWIDHNSLSSCYDGLIDVVYASTGVTISNNVFTNQDEVMLLGHSDGYTADKDMKVTVAYNLFGPGLVEGMPRCRFGYFHIVNNDYLGWETYAFGGSSHPTIISEGNRFQASQMKEVTKRMNSGGPDSWEEWQWRSIEDTFLNGAYFVQSGEAGSWSSYGLASMPKFTPSMTEAAGALPCVCGQAC